MRIEGATDYLVSPTEGTEPRYTHVLPYTSEQDFCLGLAHLDAYSLSTCPGVPPCASLSLPEPGSQLISSPQCCPGSSGRLDADIW